MRRGQTSLEFMFLIGFMFIIFAIFFIVIQERTIQVQQQRDYISLKEINNIIKSEVRTAQFFSNGYTRNFTLPPLIYGRQYTVNISEDRSELFFNISGLEYIDFLDNETHGMVTPGLNTVCRREFPDDKTSYVFINNCTPPLWS
jgi:hypothetical protein